MSIEIKELIVRVTVNKSHSKTVSEKSKSISTLERKEIIKECVEKVMEKLELKSLR